MVERDREQIQLYMDGQLDAADAETVEALLKADKDAKAYHRDLIKVQNRIRRLEHARAFSHFIERWPIRVRDEHERKIIWRRTVRIASSVAAAVLVAFIGFGVFFSDLGQKNQANKEPAVMFEMAAEEAPEPQAMTAPKSDLAESDGAMRDGLPAAGAAPAEAEEAIEEAAAAEVSDAVMAEEAEGRTTVIQVDSAGIFEMYNRMADLTEGDEARPVLDENAITIRITEENRQELEGLLNEKGIIYGTLSLGGELVLIF